MEAPAAQLATPVVNEVPELLAKAAPADDSWPCVEGICSMARACVEGRCVACEAHEQCLAGELCVKGSCVEQSKVECTSDDECADPEAECLLSGVTGTRRGNETMTAACLSPWGGEEPPAEDHPVVVVPPASAAAGISAGDELDDQLRKLL